MKPWFKYVGLGFLAYLIFFIVEFPANQAYFLMEDILDEKKVPIELYDVKGSVWHGKAGRLVYNGRAFNNFSWRFQPVELLKGKLSLALNYKNADGYASTLASMNVLGTLALEDTKVSMSAQEILTLAKIPAFKLGGQFDLNLANLDLADKKLTSVNGRLVWSGAQSIFPQKLVIGDVFANMSTGDDGVINVKLGDSGGPLELNGNLSIMPDGKYDFASEMAAREGRQSALGQSLGFMARYNSAGKAEFKRAGNISEFDFLFK